MKIIFIASAASIHTLRWIKFFIKNKDFEIEWITFAHPNHQTKNEYELLKSKVLIHHFKSFKGIFNSLKSILNSNKKLIHIHYLGWHSLLLLFVNNFNSKIILTPWGSDIKSIKFGLKKIWLKNIFTKCSFVICDSERLKETSTKLGAKKKNIMISMFGVDVNEYKSKRQIFTDLPNIFIGSNRRLETIYDVKTFIESAKIICEKKNNLMFLIAGEGSLEKIYKRYVEKNKLQKKVKFLGSLNKKEMIDFYNKLDIYVSTSLSDGGLSSSIAEAMSFKRIVLVTKNSDNLNWIKEEESGFLFDEKDSKSLVEKIEKIISSIDESKIKQISENSRELIKNKYSYTKEMGKTDAIYKNLFESFNSKIIR